MVNALKQTVIKANVNIILVTIASGPRRYGRLPPIVGFVERQHDPMTPGRPTMWLLARLIRLCCLLIGVAISKGVGETNPRVGRNWPSCEAIYPNISLAYTSDR
jgi:hypothetical protein